MQNGSICFYIQQYKELYHFQPFKSSWRISLYSLVSLSSLHYWFNIMYWKHSLCPFIVLIHRILKFLLSCILVMLRLASMATLLLWKGFSEEIWIKHLFTLYTIRKKEWIVMPPYEEESVYCFANVGRSVGPSVFCPSVTFSFPINNSRMPWPTFLVLCPHIHPGQQRNPIDFKGQGHRVKLFQIFKVKITQMSFFFILLCNLFWTDLSSCTKHLWPKIFRGHNVSQTSLVLYIDSMSDTFCPYFFFTSLHYSLSFLYL